MQENSIDAEMVSAKVQSLICDCDYEEFTPRVQGDVFNFLMDNPQFKINKTKDGKNKDNVLVLSGKAIVSGDELNFSIMLPTGYPDKPPKFYILDDVDCRTSVHVKKRNNQVSTKHLKKWKKESMYQKRDLDTAFCNVIESLSDEPPMLIGPSKFAKDSDDPEIKEYLVGTVITKIDAKLTEYSRSMAECESRAVQSMIQLSSNKGKLISSKEQISQKTENLVDEMDKSRSKIVSLNRYFE